MKVLAVSHAYPRQGFSSHGIFVHRLHKGLAALGVDVRVVQLAEWAPPWPFTTLYEPWRNGRRERQRMLDELDGIRMYHPRVFTPRPSRLFPSDSWELRASTLARYCVQNRELSDADVVLAHFLVPDGYHALSLRRALGVPLAAMAWGDDVHAWPERNSVWLAKLRTVLSDAELLIGCSARIASDANEWMDVARPDWRVVYGGVDVDTFHPPADRGAARGAMAGRLPAASAPGTRILSMIAQPVVAKGYLDLLDAWSVVSKEMPEWHLAAAGAIGDLDIAAEAAKRGCAERVHWLGAITPDDVAALMAASDAFVLPSHNEGLSLSVLEAMATGLATIATDVGGHAEVFATGNEGWLIPPRDVGALERALREVLANESVRAERGRHARAAAERVGRPVDNARLLLGILEQTVAVSRNRGRRSA